VLDNATGEFNWCVYGSDFPPNAKDNSSGGYDLKGSPPFIINGTIEWTANTYSGAEITALTDATGCPGVWCGRDGEAAGLLDCCATGTTNCSDTCKTIGTYTTNDGACTGECNYAYLQQRNACGDVINEKYDKFENDTCHEGCVAKSGTCATYDVDKWCCTIFNTNNPKWSEHSQNCCSYCTGLGFNTCNLVDVNDEPFNWVLYCRCCNL
jgi:hypothetical protein